MILVAIMHFFNEFLRIFFSFSVHFHMAGNVDQLGGYTNATYVKDCSIHHSFSR